MIYIAAVGLPQSGMRSTVPIRLRWRLPSWGLTDLTRCGFSPTLANKKEQHKLLFLFGAGGGTRTHMMSPSADFESATSTSSITPAWFTIIV